MLNFEERLYVGALFYYLARPFTILPYLSLLLALSLRSVSGESLGSSQFFSDFSCPGHMHGFLNSPAYMTTFECPSFPQKLSPRLFLLFRQVSCMSQPKHNSLSHEAVGFSDHLTMFLSSDHQFSALSGVPVGENR